MKIKSFILGWLLLCANAFAGPGHDHGAPAASAAATGPVAPRFSTHSDLFEVVGTVDGPHLDVQIDRFGDNTPVTDAKVEIESGKLKLTGKLLEDSGTYEFDATGMKENGTYPLVITISSGKTTDILAADLVVGQQASGHHGGLMHELEELMASPRRFAASVAAVLLGIVGFIWLLKRRRSLKKGGV